MVTIQDKLTRMKRAGQQQADFLRRRVRDLRNDLFGAKCANAELTRQNVKLTSSLSEEKKRNKRLNCALQQEKEKHKHLQDHTAALLYAGDDFCVTPQTPPPNVNDNSECYGTPKKNKDVAKLLRTPPPKSKKKVCFIVLLCVVLFL